MKPRRHRTAKQAALSAFMNGLTVPLTNLRAMSQTLASGRVRGQMVREYALMCASETSKLIRLVEMFVTKEAHAGTRTREANGRHAAPPLDSTTSRQRRGATTR